MDSASRHRRSPRPAMLALLLIGLAGLVCGGCGGEKTREVTGTVTYRGKPLPRGNVIFVPGRGGPLAPAPIGPNGAYRVDAPPGAYRVAVTAMPPLETVAGQNPEESVGPARSLIPERYGNPETSGIAVTVEAETTNQLDITLR